MNDAYQIDGIRLAARAAGIRYRDRDDLVLLELAPASHCAATFTLNAFCAAPIVIAKRHLAQHAPRYLLINSGNANAGTGTRGLDDARQCCASVARIAGCETEAVLPFSTGVIGEDLPVARIEAALPALLGDLQPAGWQRAARAIMTTDRVPKLARQQFVIGSHRATLVGMAKGAGMIRPDMATMLAFLATDAAVEPNYLSNCLTQAVQQTFNRITIDGDTSTNDACVLAATGALGNPPIGASAAADADTFAAAVKHLCQTLATAIVRDGEGATKLVGVEVTEARDEAEARRVAETVAHSPLVKTALFASDPNWGRILAAVGRTSIDELAIERVRIWLDDVCIVSAGGRDPEYREAEGRRVMSADQFDIRIALGRGTSCMRLLTCDLSYDYVRINAEYRS